MEGFMPYDTTESRIGDSTCAKSVSRREVA